MAAARAKPTGQNISSADYKAWFDQLTLPATAGGGESALDKDKDRKAASINSNSNSRGAAGEAGAESVGVSVGAGAGAGLPLVRGLLAGECADASACVGTTGEGVCICYFN
eukprot:COSAG06_NODE_7003_length_2681_cov_1.535244_2_plen_111_part_00